MPAPRSAIFTDPIRSTRRSSPTGPKLSDLDIPGWRKLSAGIPDNVDAIIQYGIANGRFPQRKLLMEDQRPDMISTCFNAHDECFDYEPGNEPVELYAIHDREELKEYCEISRRLGIKLEVEAFHYGGVWNAMRMMEKGLLDGPVWVTFFLGWKGGCWTPPTTQAHGLHGRPLPPGFHLEHQRHGSGGTLEGALQRHHARRPCAGRHGRQSVPHARRVCRNNAELVEKAVRIARDVGREIATPEEARARLQIEKRPAFLKS